MTPKAKICSCIRNTDRFQLFQQQVDWKERHDTPGEGDVVLARVEEAGAGGYVALENRYGRDVKLYRGDEVVCVLGTRKSGTKLSGHVPSGALERGIQLELLSMGGIVGQVDYIPSYFGDRSCILSVESFPYYDGEVLNLKTINNGILIAEDGPIHQEKFIWIGGTSAESGKTTLIAKMIAGLRSVDATRTVSAIKAVGTGRLSDLMAYSDAGADYVVDYVDMGLPSTYGISDAQYRVILSQMLSRCSSNSDISFVEIGGDLITDAALVALEFYGGSRLPFYLAVNDAMGAMNGIALLKARGIKNIVVCTYKQNVVSLAERLGVLKVVDISRFQGNVREMKEFLYENV